MPRFFVAAAAAALLVVAAAPARADKAPDAAQIRAAAEQFDAGVIAYKQKDFEGAASRFEAADAAVPGAKTLRQAIRARMEAGQGARAATLAAQAIERYPADDATTKLANDTIAKVAPLVQKLSISCASPCVLALGTRSVPGESNTRWTVFVDPGKTALSASFFGNMSSAPQEITAAAGKSSELRFEPEEKKAAPKAVIVPVPVPGSDAEKPPPGAETPPDAPPSDVVPPKSSGIHPAAFIVGTVATLGLGGATIWSGLDAKNNPGVDVVKAKCAGFGETCPEYVDGRKRQTRTNILIGATAGAGAITVVLAILTNWHGKKKAPAAEPTAVITDHGAVLGAVGTF
jgi:hypothetical protein